MDEAERLNNWISKLAFRLHLAIGSPPWNDDQLKIIYDNIDANLPFPPPE